ncbi:aminotransferase V [Paraglaciecola hydrolytica]|uniref:Aminotransferase V n=2 Tax=Paraglaciecola hydrolytica TaxID=1799789 RepID=A0A136A5I8_9ALTE|nr:aminotransferase V [Paraglaciecola hydrolytica]
MYLLSHSVGCLPKNAEQTLTQRYLNPWQQQGGDAWPKWLGIIDDFCAELGKIIGADGKDICPQSNVSSGLTKYLQALPLNPSKNVILMHASAFPSMGFVAQALTQAGYEFELIVEQHSPRDLQQWRSQISDRTAAVLITHVHSNTGVLSPVAEISALAHAKQAKVIVDVAQSIGVVPVDVVAWQADCVLGSCVKWLCGGPGAGFMWLEPSQIEALKPLDVGWFSHANPFEFDIEHFVYAYNAKRFWGGTPSIAPFATALGSLQQINQIGVAQIAKHNRQLRQKVYQAAEPLLLSQHDLEQQGGTLCLDFKPAAMQAFVEDLTSFGAYYDRRSSILRLSLHIYNTAQQATQLVDCLRKLRL